MAEPTSVAAEAPPIPDPADVAEAERFTRELFVHEGEDAATALAAGHRAPARARPRAQGDRGGPHGPLDEVAAPLLAAARPRAPARRRTSRAWPTARCSTRTRSTPSRARSPRCSPPRRATAHAVEPASAAPVLAVDEAAAYGSPEPRPEPARAAEEDDEEPTSPTTEVEATTRTTTRRTTASASRPPTRTTRTTSPTTSSLRRGQDEEEAEEDEAASYEDEDLDPGVDDDIAEGAADDPNAAKRFWFEHATGAGKTVAAMGFVDASRTGGVLILTHRRNLVDQFHGELRTRGYADRITPRAAGRRRRRGGRRPGHRRDLPVVRPQRGPDLRRLHDRHLRRGAHRAGREDLRRDPRVDGPDLHRHDGDGRADRPPRHRPLPDADLALRPRAGRAPRRHRAAALHPHPARARACGRSPRCRCAAARWTSSSTRRCWPSCWTSCRSTWRSPTSTRRASTACPASSTPPACATPTTSPRRSASEGMKARGRLGRDAQARAGRDPRPLRARRHRRARQRPAAGRGLELAARDGLHAPGADGLQAHLPAARRPRHAPPPGQGGGHRRRLRPSGDQARRPGRDAALAAGPRRLPRRRDRRRARCAAAAAGGCASSAA